MPTRRRAISLGAAALFSPGIIRPLRASEPLRVLFIGNSFIIEHDLPGMFADLAQQGGHDVQIDMIAEGGAYLADVLKDRDAFDIDREYAPGLIVLQDYSTVALDSRQAPRSHAAIRAFCQIQARRLLFATWPRREGHKLYRATGMPRTPAEMTQIVERHYAARICPDMASSLMTTVARVGQAWLLGTGLPLHRDDGYHASRTGAWLSALVLARTARLAPDQPTSPYGIASPGRLIQIARMIVP